MSILCLRINNCHLIFLIFYCITLIDPATCSWAGLRVEGMRQMERVMEEEVSVIVGNPVVLPVDVT